MRDRRARLDELAGLLSDCAAGTGALSVITGGLGSGKTALVQRFVGEAARSGAVTLVATAVRSEQPLEGGVLDQLFRGAQILPGPAERIARLVTGYLERQDAGTSARGVNAETRFFRELTGILIELSRDAPVVLAVDDLQFADGLSQRFVLHLRRWLSSARLLLVLGEWDRPYELSPRLHSHAGATAGTCIHLGLLSVSDIAEQLAEIRSERSAQQHAPEWHRVTGGNPALVRALLDDLQEACPEESPRPGPATAALALTAFQHVDPVTQRVVKAMAVLDENCVAEVVDPELVARLCGIRTHQVRQVQEFLRESGLVEKGRFRHPAVAAVAADAMGAVERAGWHRRAAEELHRRGAAAAEVARQLRALDEPALAELPWAVTVLRTAGEQALRADRVSTAVSSFELVRMLADESEVLDVTRQLVRALWLTNPSASTALVQPVRTELCDGARCGRDLLVLLWLAFGMGDGELVDRVLTRCRENSDVFDPQALAELRVLCRFHGVDAAVDSPSERGGTGLPADPWIDVAEALGGFWTGVFDSRSVHAAEHVLRSARPGETAPEVSATALLVLAYAGEPASPADEWCARVIDDARSRGAVTWQALFEVVRAQLVLRRGDAVTASRLVESALGLLPAQSWGASIAYPVGVLLMAASLLGDHGALDDALRMSVPDAVFDNVMSLFHLRARGHAHLAQGRVLAAVSDFRECGARTERHGADVPLVAPWRLDLAEASVALGRYDTARDLVTDQLERPGTDGRTRGIALRILAEVSPVDDRRVMLAESTALLSAVGDGFELAKTRKRCARGGPAQYAIESVEVGGGVHGSPTLSDSERKVVELAIAGRTNREISRALYITVSTVEQHLTRVYRKFGISGRARLREVFDLETETGGMPVWT